MLLKIREKSQGLFARIILILIGVTFALWGIQNYVGGGTEAAIISVGDKSFYQQDINNAYSQFSQNLAGTNFDENVVKKQALEKLIQDEVLWQHVENEKLVVTDNSAKNFIKTLEYFQTDGKFDNKQYKALLGAQRLSSAEFVARIKKAMVMEQFQRSIVGSGFVTNKDINNFFRIQNQQRDVELISVALPEVKQQPTKQAIESYYQQNQQTYLTQEQVAIEYVELSLADLALQVESSTEQLMAYYEEQKDLYTTKERRKISHILFAFTKDVNNDEEQLKRSIKARQELQTKDFAVLASEVSDDMLTASKGGDLGLFNIGVMEKAFEDSASSLKLGEVSEPVKSAFGYHLIKVTELVAGEVKSFASVKDKLTQAYQVAESENTFYELGESLAEISYENPDSLQAADDELGLKIKTTGLFAKKSNNISLEKLQILTEPAIINTAFSEDVLKGNNSEPIELGTDKLVVLRILEHKPAEVKSLKDVKAAIISVLVNNIARESALEKALTIKQAVFSGESMKNVAKDNGFKVKQLTALTRANGDISWQLNQEIFKAAKPVDGKSTVIAATDATGAQTVINLLAVREGVMTERDKAKQKLAEANMSKAFGEAEFNAVIDSLRANIDIKVNIANE
ncbi:MAG: SurA N-terminal domain-containing protein [Methylococcales bacterium]|nr:SurA N-terminal domain-containing protein [Methylococcales bacterium]